MGFAALDLSTGEFRATEFQGADAPGDAGRIVAAAAERTALRSSAPLFESSNRREPIDLHADPTLAAGGRSTIVPRHLWMIGCSPPIMPFRFWKIILACSRWKDLDLRESRRQRRRQEHPALCRSTQRGTLEHVDRIGFYERQDCLVLDAVTVRNLELIEPLFAGTDAGVTLFRPWTRLLLPWASGCCAPGCCGLRLIEEKSRPGWTPWSRRSRNRRARGIAAGSGRNSGSGTAAKPSHTGNRESTGRACVGGFTGANSGGYGPR